MAERLSHREQEHVISEAITDSYNEYNITRDDVDYSDTGCRILVDYTEKEKRNIKKDKLTFEREFMDLEDEVKTAIIYPNQSTCAEKVIEKFKDRTVVNVFVFGLTQVGKTGTMLSIISILLSLERKDVKPIILDNIYIITGLSDKDWVKQTTERFPKCMQKNVYHRGTMKKFAKDIRHKQNVLIIMDEVHIASETGQTISKTFKELGYDNMQYLLKNDIKFVEFSATPNGVIIDLLTLSDDYGNSHTKVVNLRPGEGYTSLFDYYENGRILPSKKLLRFKRVGKKQILDKKKTMKNLAELHGIIYKKYGLERPKYHIIRLNINHFNQSITCFEEMFGDDFIIRGYHNEGDVDNINTLLNNTPEKHTIIFVKEKLRCAFTFTTKDHIGIVYERYGDDDSVHTQGLAGRLTGYNVPPLTPLNDGPIIFMNVVTINRLRILKRSMELLEQEEMTLLEFRRELKWKSSTTQNLNSGRKRKRRTFAAECSASKEFPVEDRYPNVEMKEFYTYEDVMHHYRTVVYPSRKNHNPYYNGRGPKDIEEDETGFRRPHVWGVGLKKIHTREDVIANKGRGLSADGGGYRLYTFYEDITDNTTLRYALCYKKLPEEETPRVVAFGGGGGGAAAGW